MILSWSLTLVQAGAAATPLALAGLGELVAERGGVINVGIEGLMTVGALAGAAVASMTGDAWLGLAAALAGGMALGAVFACATVLARVDQIVCGMAINLLAVGISGTSWVVLQERQLAQVPPGAGFHPLWCGQFGLTAATVALAALVWWVLRATRGGLIVRALGDAPAACAAAGIGIRRWRVSLVILAAGAAGVAGAYFSLMRVHGYTPGTTGGSGFLVLALVIFGRWRVESLLAGCLLFGMIESLQLQLQARGYNAHVPYQLLQMLPYLAALAALAVLSRSAPGPRHLGEPWPARIGA